MATPRKARTRLYMERALEQTCRSLPYGGDHELRAFVAERMIAAAESRWITLGELGIVARKALADYNMGVEPHKPLNSSTKIPLTPVLAA